MLQDIIPASWRRFVYALYTVAATIVGALNVGGVNTGKAVDVLAYLGIAVGAVAAGNVATKPPVQTARIKLRNEDGFAEPGSLALGLVLGIVLGYLLFR